VLGNIGGIHRRRGDYDLAMDYNQKSRALSDSLGNKLGIANRSGEIGQLYFERGDYASAMKFFQEGLALNEAIGYKRGVVGGLNSIGIVHSRQGNFKLALEYYQRSLEVAESLRDRPESATALDNIGLIYSRQGDYLRAEEHYQKSLKLAESLRNKSKVAYVLSNMAANYWMQGAHGLALVNYQKSLQLREELGAKGRIAENLIGIAKVYDSQGDYVQAAAYAERAISSAGKIGDREALWDALTQAATAHLALGQPLRARQEFEEAILIIEALRTQVAGGEQAQQRVFEGKVSPYHEMVALLAAQGKADEALTYAERGKARVLLDVLRSGKLNVTKAMTSQEKEKERRIRDMLVSFNTQISGESRRSQPDQTRLAQLTAQLEKARLEHQDFQTRLYAAHPELRIKRGESQPLKLEQAGELLTDAKTALLEYVVADDRTFLFALTASPTTRKGQQQPLLRLYEIKIKRQDLLEKVQKLRQRLANNDLDYAELSSQLYKLLVAPAGLQLQGKTRLVIVPDDLLWEMPFQALRSTNGRFLIQEAAISYAPSLTVLREIGKSRKPKSATTLLAMGNPKLAGQTISRAKNVSMSASFEPLPEAERLVKGLSQIYGAKASKVYVGGEAREEVLKAESSRYRILQLATHGVINNASPMYSHVVLAESENAKEDGLLEAWEIMGMDLQADLAVLSACETARGRIGAGEGVIGLSWALFVAGCPTTVVSQWKVESSSTTELMLAFHGNLKGGATKSEALRQAALKLLADKKYNHPFYWASFIVVGDGN
jgi:CHAT domain-containing protein